MHLSLAALFGLILPFICWGAEATPGHPHLRPHFVFAVPVRSAAYDFPAARTAQELIHATNQAVAAGAYHMCTAPLHSADTAAASTPTSQSTPLVLAVTILLLAAIGAHFSQGRRDNAGWLLRTRALILLSPALAVATPPPRLSTFS
jgi:hypothetical protein